MYFFLDFKNREGDCDALLFRSSKRIKLLLEGTVLTKRNVPKINFTQDVLI